MATELKFDFPQSITFNAKGESGDDLLQVLQELDSKIKAGYDVAEWRLVGKLSLIGNENEDSTITIHENIKSEATETQQTETTKEDIPAAVSAVVDDEIQDKFGEYIPQMVTIHSNVPQHNNGASYYTASVSIQAHKGKTVIWRIAGKYEATIPYSTWKEGRDGERRYFNIPCTKSGELNDFSIKHTKWGPYLKKIEDEKVKETA